MKKSELLYKSLEMLSECPNLDAQKFQGSFLETGKAYGLSSIYAVLSPDKGERVVMLETDLPKGEEVCYKGMTGDDKQACVYCKISKGCIISEEDRTDLEFMCRMIYVILGRLRVVGLIDKLYFFDTATGLPNLNNLIKMGNRLVAKDKICDYTAYFINIKGFNYINKKVQFKNGVAVFAAFGKAIGDKLDEDEIIARLGGDNFVILAKKEKHELVLNLLRGIELKMDIDGQPNTILIRSRASIYPIDTKPEQFGVIMNHITSVLGYGKNVLNKDFVYCTPEIEQKIVRQKSFGQMFEKSLESNEFFVMYQPKVLVTSNSIYGGEALVRWNSEGVAHSPAEFIQTLEREHLICRLDYFVLEQTCKMLKKIIDEGIEPVRVSVNFSNEHLTEEKLVEKVKAVVDKYNIPHRFIEIEMTETVDFEESKIMREYVNELQGEGFSVAMDDFGIGYSSLNLLKLVPVDVLKIDKEFITELNSDVNQREKIIIQNIINMASELGIEVVAEGVETKLQIEMLKGMSCNRIQGFIFDRPLSEEKFIAKLSNRQYDPENLIYDI